MKIKKHIANTVTCLNVICGCIAAASIMNNRFIYASIFIYLAMIFDFADGLVARALNVKSEFGKQLDSLADAISFGLVPGMLMFYLINTAIDFSNVDIQSNEIPRSLSYLGFSITVFSVLRLAKFNIDTRQTSSFLGLPTPANAMIIMSFPLILKWPWGPIGSEHIIKLLLNPTFLISLTIIISTLMVVELPLFALKFKNLSFKDNYIKYLFLILSVVLLLNFYFLAIPMIIILYVILSIINNFIKPTENHEI